MSFIKNQIIKRLERFIKNLSSDMLSISLVKGEAKLTKVNIDEKALMEMLKFPRFIILQSAICNEVFIKIPWTKLKTDPIYLAFDCVEVQVILDQKFDPSKNFLDSIIDSASETIQNLNLELNNAHHIHPPTGYNKMLSNLQSSTSYTSLIDKIIEGVKISINTLIITITCPDNFRANIELTSIMIHSTTHNWKPCNLKLSRISLKEYGTYLHFKEIFWNNTRVEVQILYDQKPNTALGPSLKILTNQNRIKLITQKFMPNTLATSFLPPNHPLLVHKDMNSTFTSTIPALNLVHSEFMMEDFLCIINENQIPDIIFMLSAILRVANSFKSAMVQASHNHSNSNPDFSKSGGGIQPIISHGQSFLVYNPNLVLAPFIRKQLLHATTLSPQSSNSKHSTNMSSKRTPPPITYGINRDKLLLFAKYQVMEESSHVHIDKIDFHLCQNASSFVYNDAVNKSLNMEKAATASSTLKSLQVLVENVVIDAFPKHYANMGKEHWNPDILEKNQNQSSYLENYWCLLDKYLSSNKNYIDIAKESLFEKCFIVRILGSLRLQDLSRYDIPPTYGIILQDKSTVLPTNSQGSHPTTGSRPLSNQPIVRIEMTEYYYQYIADQLNHHVAYVSSIGSHSAPSPNPSLNILQRVATPWNSYNLLCQKFPHPEPNLHFFAQDLQFICQYDSLAWLSALAMNASNLWNTYYQIFVPFRERYHTDTDIHISDFLITLPTVYDKTPTIQKSLDSTLLDQIFYNVYTKNVNICNYITSCNDHISTKRDDTISHLDEAKLYMKQINDCLVQFDMSKAFPERPVDSALPFKKLDRLDSLYFYNAFFPITPYNIGDKNGSTFQTYVDLLGPEGKSNAQRQQSYHHIHKLFSQLAYTDKWSVDAQRFMLYLSNVVPKYPGQSSHTPIYKHNYLIEPIMLNVWLVPTSVKVKGDVILSERDAEKFIFQQQTNLLASNPQQHTPTQETSTSDDDDMQTAYFNYRVLCRIFDHKIAKNASSEQQLKLIHTGTGLRLNFTRHAYLALNRIVDCMNQMQTHVNEIISALIALNESNNYINQPNTIMAKRPSTLTNPNNNIGSVNGPLEKQNFALIKENIRVNMILYLHTIVFRFYETTWDNLFGANSFASFPRKPLINKVEKLTVTPKAPLASQNPLSSNPKSDFGSTKIVNTNNTHPILSRISNLTTNPSNIQTKHPSTMGGEPDDSLSLTSYLQNSSSDGDGDSISLSSLLSIGTTVSNSAHLKVLEEQQQPSVKLTLNPITTPLFGDLEHTEKISIHSSKDETIIETGQDLLCELTNAQQKFHPLQIDNPNPKQPISTNPEIIDEYIPCFSIFMLQCNLIDLDIWKASDFKFGYDKSYMDFKLWSCSGHLWDEVTKFIDDKSSCMAVSNPQNLGVPGKVFLKMRSSYYSSTFPSAAESKTDENAITDVTVDQHKKTHFTLKPNEPAIIQMKIDTHMLFPLIDKTFAQTNLIAPTTIQKYFRISTLTLTKISDILAQDIDTIPFLVPHYRKESPNSNVSNITPQDRVLITSDSRLKTSNQTANCETDNLEDIIASSFSLFLLCEQALRLNLMTALNESGDKYSQCQLQMLPFVLYRLAKDGVLVITNVQDIQDSPFANIVNDILG